MWFKQGISLEDSNFDLENYPSLADVKLLLKRILDSYWNKLLCKFCNISFILQLLLERILDIYWNKLLCKFCITVHCFHARVQSSACATYEKCNNSRANPEIGYTTDCLYSFWDRQKSEFGMLYSFVGTITNIYLAEKKMGIANWPIGCKKQYVFARQLPHTKVFI